MFNYDDINKLKEEASAVALKERLNYKDIYNEIELFISKNDIILAGKLSITLLLNEERDKNDYKYVLYTENPLKFANALTNILAPNKFVSMKTIQYSKEFVINVFGRQMVRIYDLEIHKGIPLRKLIKTIPYYSITKKETTDKSTDTIKLMSSEISLIDIYRKLYDPMKAKKWPDILKIENELFKIMDKTYVPYAVDGGYEKDLKKYLMDNFVQNHVLIGKDAVNILLKRPITKNRLQIISELKIDDCIRKIKETLEFDADIIHKEQRLLIPKDYRIRRYKVSIMEKLATEPLLVFDIYNSATFELIPYEEVEYNKKTYKIGNVWVLCRFLLIDIYMASLLMELNKMDKSVIPRLLADYKEVRKLDLVFGDKYAGMNIPIKIYKKKSVANIADYVPAIYSKKDGTLRDIS